MAPNDPGAKALAARREELRRLTVALGLDAEPYLNDLDRGNDGLIVAVYATLLGIDVRQAFDPDIPLHSMPYTPRPFSSRQDASNRPDGTA